MYKDIFAENDAFMANYNAVKPFIKGLMRKAQMVGIEPEDMEAELMLKLFEASKVYDSTRGTQFHTYIIGCLNNQYKEIISAKMAKKRNSGMMEYSLDYKLDADREKCTLQDLIAAEAADPFEMCWMGECVDAIKDFYRCFGNERERDMLYMHYNGVKQSEIAQKYGCGQSLVSYNITKFKNKLKEFLTSEGYICA